MPSLLLPRAISESDLFNILVCPHNFGSLWVTWGVLWAQFIHYLGVNERDSVPMKLFVAGLSVLTTLKSIQTLALNWLQTSSLFRSLEALSNLWWSFWLSELTGLLGAIIMFYVQMFFCHRLWALSYNIYLVIAAATLFIVALAAASVAAQFFQDTWLSSVWYAVYLGFAMVGELLQTGSIVFYLVTPSQRQSKNALPRGPTKSILNSLLRTTLQSAAPGALWAVIDFVANIMIIRHTVTIDTLSVASVISAIATIILPKLYAITAMWTLNSREDICSAAANQTVSLSLDLESTSVVCTAQSTQ
ncbi:hypothetical protein K438DRAFT_1963619 [Mycena galopus ATCC 62051]|nr:hypothetical protein K438DRAFT_1963619 [Mycena galopus ATCC 62051]